MSEVYNCQIKGKLYNLLFNMNKSVNITVNTPVGKTESAVIDCVVSQGTIESGVMSSVNIGKGIDVAFADSDGEVVYVDFKMNPMSFMDDINRYSESVKSAQDGNNRIQYLVESKCLSLNLDKCCYLIMGSRKTKKKLKKETEETPLTLYDKPMNPASSVKILGDYLCSTL